jgi:parallel beta-helix repeat protein
VENIIKKNFLSNNKYTSFGIRTSNGTLVEQNIVQDNNEYGIQLNSAFSPPIPSINNIIRNNEFSNNTISLVLSDDALNNTIERNKFIRKGLHYNAMDENDNKSQSNRYLNNYWSEWTEPDSDGDYIVDIPYFIYGTNNNQDPYPLVLPFDTFPIINHGIISIQGNNEFKNQAKAEGWTGDGTKDNPFIIQNYRIKGNGTENLIYIVNTNVYFTLINLFLRNGKIGVNLGTVFNGNITHVHSTDNAEAGFRIGASQNNILSFNVASNNSEYGAIMLSGSENNTVMNNTIVNNKAPGVYSWVSNNNSIINNCISNNAYAGISLRSSNGSLIFGNTIESNPIGIDLNSGFIPPRISKNNIMDQNTISKNDIGISLTADTSNNTIMRNSFISNLKNAVDENTQEYESNTFFNNYWSNWISPDVNNDFIVDQSYSISGSANNKDPSPLVVPYGAPHIIKTTSVSITTSNSIHSDPNNLKTNTTTSNQSIVISTPGFELFSTLFLLSYINLVVIQRYRKKKNSL